MLKTNRAGSHHHVPRLHIQRNAAAGSHTDKGIRANGDKLLHGNGGRGTANTGGADTDFFAKKRSRIDIVFPVLGDMDRIVKEARNCFTASGISGQKHIASHIPLLAVDVKLHTNILHRNPPFVKNI